VCWIEISYILFCLIFTFKLANALALDDLWRLMTSVGMLVYSIECLLCFTVFEIIMLIEHNKMRCVCIVYFLCFIFLCLWLVTLRVLSSITVPLYQHIIEKYLNSNYSDFHFFYFRAFYLDFTGWGSLTKHSLFIIPPNVSNYTSCVNNGCIVR
jgi:hypothetical protein